MDIVLYDIYSWVAWHCFLDRWLNILKSPHIFGPLGRPALSLRIDIRRACRKWFEMAPKLIEPWILRCNMLCGILLPLLHAWMRWFSIFNRATTGWTDSFDLGPILIAFCHVPACMSTSESPEDSTPNSFGARCKCIDMESVSPKGTESCAGASAEQRGLKSCWKHTIPAPPSSVVYRTPWPMV